MKSAEAARDRAMRALLMDRAPLVHDAGKCQPECGLMMAFGVTEEPDRSWVKSSLTAHPLKSLNDHLRLTDPEIVSRFPRTHVHCGHGGRLERLAQRALARRPQPPREPGWRLRGLDTGHDCMITEPRGLANLLLED